MDIMWIGLSFVIGVIVGEVTKPISRWSKKN